MSKSIKLQDDIFWDGSSITLYDFFSNDTRLNRMSLKEALDNANKTGLIKKCSFWGYDMNETLKYGTGIFVFSSKTQNAPIYSELDNIGYYVIQITNSSVNYGLQIAFCVWNDTDHIYIRHCIAGDWKNWKTITLN